MPYNLRGPLEIVITEQNYRDYAPGGSAAAGVRHGLIPRNYSLNPVGSYPWATAVDFPLIDKAEWADRLAKMEADKSRLSDIRMLGNAGQMIPSRDQNGKGYSHSADTEVLTVKGWVRWPDWNHTDLLASVNTITGLMEFQAPTEWHAYEYDDEIYASTNRRLDFAVTRNHRMLVRKWDERRRTLSGDYTFQRADQLGWYVGMMHAPSGFLGTEMVEVSPEGELRTYDGDDFIALCAVVSSCGYAGGSESTRERVSFCCFDDSRYAAYAALAKRCGFSEQPGRKGVWTAYRIGLAQWFRANGYTGGLRAAHKRVPDLIKWASSRQIRHFLTWFGDQNHKEGSQPCFYSSSKQMIDDLQELLLRVGKRGTIRGRGPRTAIMEDGKVIDGGPSYVLTVSETDRLCIDRKKHIETDHYRGLVYCATVPNGTLVTRRNGSVLISGNCWAHSGVSAHLLVRAVMGQPFADLSAYSIACPIKNFQDEGGWGAQGVDYQIANGCATSATWPQQSMSRSNVNEAEKADAAKHKMLAQWADLSAGQYDRNLTFAQMATLLLNCAPVVVDYSWWGHSIVAADLVKGSGDDLRNASGKLLREYDPVMFEFIHDATGYGDSLFGVRIWNSWGDTWSQQGMGVLDPSKAVPNGAVGAKLVMASGG